MSGTKKVLTRVTLSMAVAGAVAGSVMGMSAPAHAASSALNVHRSAHTVRPNVGGESCNAEENPIKFYFPNTYTCFGGGTGTELVGFGAISMQSGDYGGSVGYNNNNGCFNLNFSPYHTYGFSPNTIITSVTTTERD